MKISRVWAGMRNFSGFGRRSENDPHPRAGQNFCLFVQPSEIFAGYNFPGAGTPANSYASPGDPHDIPTSIFAIISNAVVAG